MLADIASGLAAATEPWEFLTGEVPKDRRYQRLLSTPEYEAWVICWPAGTALDLHDHGGSAGAFTVIAGGLDELTVADGDVSVRRYEAGETASFGARARRCESGRASGDERARVLAAARRDGLLRPRWGWELRRRASGSQRLGQCRRAGGPHMTAGLAPARVITVRRGCMDTA